MRNDSKVVLKYSSAEEDDWSEAHDILEIVLAFPHQRTFWIVQLVVDEGLSEAECGDETDSVAQSDLDESFPPSENQFYLVCTRPSK